MAGRRKITLVYSHILMACLLHLALGVNGARLLSIGLKLLIPYAWVGTGFVIRVLLHSHIPGQGWLFYFLSGLCWGVF